MTTAVGLRNVTKHFGDVVAVDGVDLDIEAGEFFAMLGPVRLRARRRCCA